MTTPHGHNEQHKLRAHLTCPGHYGSPTTPQDEDVKEYEVSNLVIDLATVSPPDYLKFDPDGDEQLQHPTIAFTAQDLGKESPTQAYVFIRDTADNRWEYEEGSYRTIFLASISLNQQTSVEWDGINDAGEVMPKGTYAFDILVEQPEENDAYYTGYPTNYFGWYRSEFAAIGDHELEFVCDEDDNLVARIGYEYADNAAADEVHVDFVGPDLDVKWTLSELPTSPAPDYHDDITLYTFLDSDPPGEYRAVFMATDNHGPQYRDHLGRKVMAVNKSKGANGLAVRGGAVGGDVLPEGPAADIAAYLRKGGWVVPASGSQSRVLEQPTPEEVLQKWLGYKTAGLLPSEYDARLQSSAFHEHCHGGVHHFIPRGDKQDGNKNTIICCNATYPDNLELCDYHMLQGRVSVLVENAGLLR